MRHPVHALLDADSLLYQAAWGGTTKAVLYSTDEEPTDVVNLETIKTIVDDKIALWAAAADAVSPEDTVTLVLSGPGKTFRHLLHPEYKANRPPTPETVVMARDYMLEKYPVVRRGGLEADDVIAMLATRPHHASDPKTVVVSIDKDLLQIPGYHVIPGETLELCKSSVTSVREGRHNMWLQALIGDTTDNFKGAPGIGKVKGTKLLEGLYGSSDAEYWHTVLSVYQQQFTAGKSREKFMTSSPHAEACMNLYCARLLVDGDATFSPNQLNVNLRTPHGTLCGKHTVLAIPLKEGQIDVGIEKR